MKRTVALMLSVALVLALLLPVMATADPVTYLVRTKNGKPLNVRPEPNTHNIPLGKIKNGTTVEVDYLTGYGWAAIQFEGKLGFISTHYITPMYKGQKAETIPVTVNKSQGLALEQATLKPITDVEYIVTRPERVTGWVNLRQGPATTTKALTRMEIGRMLQLNGETDNWYLVTDLRTGLSGYVAKVFANRIVPEQSTDAAAATEKLGKLNVSGAFDLECKLPEGYTIQVINQQGESIVGYVSSPDLTKPTMVLSVGFDETMSDVQRLNDVSAEDLAKLEQTFKTVNDVAIEYRETAAGTRLMVVKETGADADFVDVVTVYRGYMIEFVMTPGTAAAEQKLTDDQIKMCVDFLSNLNFIEAAK